MVFFQGKNYIGLVEQDMLPSQYAENVHEGLSEVRLEKLQKDK